MAMLRAPFTVRALSNCRRFVKVTWGDGAESTFPNMWLRASIRDEPFFDLKSCSYQHSHLDFLIKGATISRAQQTEDGEDVEVQWEDHTSIFDASWLRAQDLGISTSLLPTEYEQVPWGGEVKLPVFEYSHKGDQVMDWMLALKKRGLAVIRGVPKNEKGWLDCMHMIGPVTRRYHPTDIIIQRAGDEKAMATDPVGYGRDFLGCHTDTTYYKPPVRLVSLLCTEYSTPEEGMVNFFTDGVKVVQEFRKENPEAFHLLSTVKCRYSRHRLGVEEPCDPADVRIYEWDACRDTPVIDLENNTVQRLHFKFVAHAGMPLQNYSSSQTERFYQAFRALKEAMDNPKNHYNLVLEPGTAVIVDNYRVLHGRYPIPPAIKRTLVGGFISDMTFNSRWRILMGELSGLESKWRLGCSDETLEILSKRKQ